MTKLKILLAVLLLFFSINTVTYAQETESIKSFQSDINILTDSQVDVKENIQYYFPVPQHGIIRYIPVKYATENAGSLTGSYDVYLTVTEVKAQKEGGEIESVPFEENESGGKMSVKIGDPNKEISGNWTYIINYKVQRAINFSPKDNENQDEFYWNVTGNGWEVPIEKSSATIHFPEDINPDIWKFGCFTGTLGSQQKECSFEATSTKSVEFKSRWELPARNGLTIVAGFPKNIIKQPTASENFYLALQHNLLIYVFLLIPLLAFIFLFVLWFLKGRDPQGNGTIIPFYGPPNNLTPVELGALVDEKADPKDVSSSIIDLAVRGYIKIREIERRSLFGLFKNNPDYELTLLRKDDAMPKAEKNIFEAIFPASATSGNHEVKLSELQNSFPQKLNSIKEGIYNDLVQKGYFPKSPQRVRNTYLFIGAIAGFLGIILFVNDFGVIGAGSMLLTGGLIAIFGYFMPRKTIKGVDAYEKILGLKEYLTVAEKDRIKFHNAPEKRPQHFEKLLPYAMVLGVEREWAKQFEGIYTHPPTWYEGSSMNNFSALYLANSLSSFRDTANAAIGMRTEGGGASGGSSGFGGGGFSGGGFGGGGGSSW